MCRASTVGVVVAIKRIKSVFAINCKCELFNDIRKRAVYLVNLLILTQDQSCGKSVALEHSHCIVPL